jgi:hypothetical protein
MPASILRTNYRRTGGKLDITAIGGGFLDNASNAGSGPTNWNGGFIYIISYSGSIGGSAAAKSFSNWIADSAYGLLSWVYTSLSPGSGYKFLPLGVKIRSISDTNVLQVGASMTMPGYGYGPTVFSFSTTGSITVIYIPKYNYGALTGSAAPVTALSFSGEGFLADLWGFIVSAP